MSTASFEQTPLLDRLSAYDIAVLEMTSPAVIPDDGIKYGDQILLTSKASYLWAGAIAHVLVNRPNMTEEDVFERISYAIREHAHELRDIYQGIPTLNNVTAQPYVGLNIIGTFLQSVDLPDDAIGQVARNTAEAIKRLEEAELIEDPLKKWMGKALLGVLLLVPVNYTSTTEKGGALKTEVDTIILHYDSEQYPDHTDRHVKVKVDKVVKIFKEKIVPAVEEFATDDSKSKGDSKS